MMELRVRHGRRGNVRVCRSSVTSPLGLRLFISLCRGTTIIHLVGAVNTHPASRWLLDRWSSNRASSDCQTFAMERSFATFENSLVDGRQICSRDVDCRTFGTKMKSFEVVCLCSVPSLLPLCRNLDSLQLVCEMSPLYRSCFSCQ